VMVSGGKAFYRTERVSGWSEHKSASQNPSRNSSRRPSSVPAEEAKNPKNVALGEDEEGRMVDFVTDLVDLSASRRPSRRDSNVDWDEPGVFDMQNLQAAMSDTASQRSSRKSSKGSAEPQVDSQLEPEKKSRGSLLLPNERRNFSRRNSTAACSARENSSRRGSLQIVTPVGSHRGSFALPRSRSSSISFTGNASEAIPVIRRGSVTIFDKLCDAVGGKVTTPLGARGSLEVPMARRNSLHSGPNSRRGSLLGLQDGPPSVIEDRRSSLLGSRRGSLRGSLTLEPEGVAMVRRRSVIDRRGSVGLNIMPTVLDHEDEKMEDGESNESEDKKSADSNGSCASSKSGQNSEVAQKSGGKAPTSPSEASRSLRTSPTLRSPSPGGKGAGSDISARALKKDVVHSDRDETTSLGSDVETRLATTDPSPFTVCVSPDSRAPTTEPDRDLMSPVDGARSDSKKKEQEAKSIMSLAKVPFTRDLDVDSLEENMLKKSTDQLPNASNMNSAQSPESMMNRRISTITSSAIGGTYKISPAPVSKVWRPVSLPEPLSSAHRTKRKYPNTPLALLWYENNGENFLFVGLFTFPTLLKIIPPKHHEPDKSGRFNVLPIDSQRVLLADESSHQIWLFNHHQHVLKHLAGCGKRGHVDGPLETCRMSSPCALTLDPRSHYIYVADRGNHVIRKIDLMSGLMSTAVGNGFRGNTDGSDRLRQCLDSPFDVSFSEPHYLIISCADNAVRSFNLKTHYLKTILVGS